GRLRHDLAGFARLHLRQSRGMGADRAADVDEDTAALHRPHVAPRRKGGARRLDRPVDDLRAAERDTPDHFARRRRQIIEIARARFDDLAAVNEMVAIHRAILSLRMTLSLSA